MSFVSFQHSFLTCSDRFSWLSIPSTFPFMPPIWSVWVASVSVVARATCLVSWSNMRVFFAASIVFPWVYQWFHNTKHTFSACWINISPPSTPSVFTPSNRSFRSIDWNWNLRSDCNTLIRSEKAVFFYPLTTQRYSHIEIVELRLSWQFLNLNR